LKRTEAKRGFTLIELVFVVFILTIVAAVVFPSFYTALSRSTSSEANLVASVIRYLNDVSRNTATEARLLLNLDERSISYESFEKQGSYEIESLYSAELTSTGVAEKGETAVVFPPTGLQEMLRVRLGEGTKFLEVLYNPYSGRVSVEDTGAEGEVRARGRSESRR